MSMTDSRPHGRSGPVAGPGVGRHLLIVDDDAICLMVSAGMLENLGHQTVTVGSAEAAPAAGDPAPARCGR